MSFLNSFKGMLYHTEGESSEQVKPTAPQAPVSSGPTPQISTPVMFSTGVNQEMASRIRTAVFERKTAYTQLLDASELMWYVAAP